jgi:hypothetical protein
MTGVRHPGDPGKAQMIRLLTDMPDGVLGLEAVDDVERENYENVIVPAIEQAIAQHGKACIVYVLGPEFDDCEGGAVWKDLKLGARNRPRSSASRSSPTPDGPDPR